MQTLILKLDTVAHATQLAQFLKTIPYIKSIESRSDEQEISLPAMEWGIAGRPATDDELLLMLHECETEEAEYTTAELKKRFKQWMTKK